MTRHPGTRGAGSVLVLLLALNGLPGLGAPLFDPDGPAVREFRLELSAPAAESLRTKPREYVRATVRLDGGPPLEIGLHLKGSTGSFRPLDDRPGLTLGADRFTAGQRIGGLSKLHLNNAVEDPSRLRELLGQELFGSIGIPSPRIGHARVRLNGRDLGLYVVAEGFTADFLGRVLANAPGTLFEPLPGADLSGPFRVNARSPGTTAPRDLRPLAATLSGAGPGRLWERLDRDPFITFTAAELILAHHDGYSLAGNNYRVLVPEGPGEARLLPHGMDRLFGAVELPWPPRMSGKAAAVLAGTDAGRRELEARVRELAPRLLDVPVLTRRVHALRDGLRPFLSVAEWTDVSAGAAELADQIGKRAEILRRQLEEATPVALRAGETIVLGPWRAGTAAAGTRLDETNGPDGRAGLHIRAEGTTLSAWAWTGRLAPGRYRLVAEAAVRGFRPLPFGRNHGAVLRADIGGQRSPSLTNGPGWTPLAMDLVVPEGSESTRFHAEFRAKSGDAWFARDGFRLTRLE